MSNINFQHCVQHAFHLLRICDLVQESCHGTWVNCLCLFLRASKRRMQNVANVSILAMFCMYLLTAVFGYLTFYENVEAEMLHTYINVDPLDKLILCVRLAVLLAVTLTVPVVLFPIRRAIHQLLFHKKDFSWPRHVTIACCLLVTVNLLVIFVPNIKDIFGVIGATSAPSLIFILPSVFYIRIVPNEKEPLLSRSKIQAACFAALGFIFMVMSLSFIIVDWVTTGKSSGRCSGGSSQGGPFIAPRRASPLPVYLYSTWGDTTIPCPALWGSIRRHHLLPWYANLPKTALRLLLGPSWLWGYATAFPPQRGCLLPWSNSTHSSELVL
ncbi:Sodium-coupled neutral amino acid transporter 3 [Varanus komodoensis]|nr:Sodium-coupled neutral amino acid transporter 3 [Varanus komodoensis]